MKQRFTSLDIQVIAHELSQKITNFRLANIYDLSSRIFLLKFALPNQKHLLVIDSGFRCHLTQFSRAASPSPSSFVSKLRKHLKTRRLTRIRQLGTDRVLELEFSEGKYRLYLEFYAGGNVVLTDETGVILAVLRVVSAGEGETGRGETKVGSVYALPTEREGTLDTRGEVTREQIVEILKSGQIPVEKTEEAIEDVPAPAGKGKKQGQGKKFKKKKGEDAIARVLSSKIPEFSPALIQHALLVVGVDPNTKSETAVNDEGMLAKIQEAFGKAREIIQDISKAEKVNGYIIAKQPKSLPAAGTGDGEGQKKKNKNAFGGDIGDLEVDEDMPEMKKDADGFVYDDFHPFKPRQFVDVEGIKIIEVEGFNQTVDEFVCALHFDTMNKILIVTIVLINRVPKAHKSPSGEEIAGSETPLCCPLRTSIPRQCPPELPNAQRAQGSRAGSQSRQSRGSHLLRQCLALPGHGLGTH